MKAGRMGSFSPYNTVRNSNFPDLDEERHTYLNVEFTGLPYYLLVYLAKHCGKVCYYPVIRNALWGSAVGPSVANRTLHVHKRRLAARLEVLNAPIFIGTIYRDGYILKWR